MTTTKVAFKESGINEDYIENYDSFSSWGLGIGDWGLGIGDWAQSPIPNPPSPIPNPHINYKKFIHFFIIIYL